MSKKPMKKKGPAAPKIDIADCGRTSWFHAHKSGATVQRLITHLPAIIGLPTIITLLLNFKKLVAAVSSVSEKLENFINNTQIIILRLFGMEPTTTIVINNANITITAIAILFVIFSLCELLSVSSEQKAMKKASNTYYYFYKDMVEIVDQNEKKREAIRTLNGVVSCRIGTPKTSLFMAILVSILKFNTKELWKYLADYSDVIITTTGNPLETIVLNDVENPGKLLENIRKHYPTATNLSVGNSFNL